MATPYMSREEIDRISDDLRIKGRHPAAVIHLQRVKGELQYRHANGKLWYAVNVEHQVQPSGASHRKRR